MDPLSLAAFAALALAGGGLSTLLAVKGRGAQRRAEMREAVRRKIPCGADPPVSLFDVFWDLGASAYALEMLSHRGLLLESPRDLSGLVTRLPSEIEEHGSYRAFIDEQLEAIRELHRDRGVGDRRAIPALSAPERKALPAAESAKSPSVIADASIAAQRKGWRSGEPAGPLTTGQSSGLDIDEAVSVNFERLLGGLLDGSIGQQVKRWFALSDARKIRTELDRALERLLAVYVEHVRANDKAIGHLYDAADRWEAETTRLLALRHDSTLHNRSWTLCAEVLLEQASELATSLSRSARSNVDDVLGRIDELAATGQAAMAGYLVYVNRYAFFVGRLQLCADVVGEIEAALARLQRELAAKRD